MFARTMPRGTGRSSGWRMFLSYLTRIGEEVPRDGVPFTALLTISDPGGHSPVQRYAPPALALRCSNRRHPEGGPRHDPAVIVLAT
jgi:hypothetical protein